MTIELTPELGVEITPDISYYDLRERAAAACNSVALLEDHGLDAKPTVSDREAAATLVTAYAEDPEKASRLVNTERASTLSPASLVALREYLDEYGRAAVTHAIEMRHLVTNRLLEESRNPDPRIRIRALELLGKHSDVGLFSERSEVTVTHQTTDELKEKLRAKLQRLIRKSDPNVIDVPATVEMGGEIIDVDAELGLTVKNVALSPAENENNPEICINPANSAE